MKFNGFKSYWGCNKCDRRADERTDKSYMPLNWDLETFKYRSMYSDEQNISI